MNNISHKISRFRLTLTQLLATFVLVNGCQGLGRFKAEPSPSRPSQLKIVIAPASYSLGQDKPNMERDLISHFAKYESYAPVWIIAESSENALQLLKEGKADIAIGRFNSRIAVKNDLLDGPEYDETPLALVCGEETDLKGPVRLALKEIDQSPYLLNHISQNLVQSSVEMIAFERTLDIMKYLSKRKADCSVLDLSDVLNVIRFFPSLKIQNSQFVLKSYSFMIQKNRVDLQMQIEFWLQSISRTQELLRIKDRYLGHLDWLDEPDRDKFFYSIKTRLHNIKPIFVKSARDFDLPWQLVAAVAFQESHWNNSALSFTGVKGIMQITQQTARRLGLEDRADLEQSVWGGAKYLRLLLNKQPKHLHKRERMAMALATYNVGVGHMRDAQRLARQFGKNPHSWRDLKSVLPLLADPSFYNNLRYGKARGYEPVDFANRVIGYYELLTTKI